MKREQIQQQRLLRLAASGRRFYTRVANLHYRRVYANIDRTENDLLSFMILN